MSGAPRNFKNQGIDLGEAATDARYTSGLRKQKQRRQDKLAMRRGRNHAVVNAPRSREGRKRTPIVVFREMREALYVKLAHWYVLIDMGPATPGLGEARIIAMNDLSNLLCFEDRMLALSAYADLFGTDRGADLLCRIARMVTDGPSSGALFQVAVTCVTEMMYEPENIACVEVMVRQGVHVSALNQLTLVDPATSEMRQELLEMVGNLTRNNRYAREIVLNTAGLVDILDANLSDAVSRGDWDLINAVFYMMYVLCESKNGGETPPLSFFTKLMPNFISTLNQIVAIYAERTDSINRAYRGAMAFLESLCLGEGLTHTNTNELVEHRRGVIILASTNDIVQSIYGAVTCGNKGIQSKAVSTLSFMCSAGVDAIKPLIGSGMCTILMSVMLKLGIEPYTRRQIFRIMFILSKYKALYMQVLWDAGVFEYMSQALLGNYGSLGTQQHSYAAWTLCNISMAEGDPLFIDKKLNVLCNSMKSVRALSESLHRCKQGGDQETCHTLLVAISRYMKHYTRASKNQFEEADGLASITQLMNVAHVHSELYKQAEFIQDTYFSNY